LNADAIRQSFIDYFAEHGHLHLPGLPLVTNDPSVTTLFTIAGMQQMIPYFLGRETPPNPNMVTVQKAVRTIDIEEVGDDTHLTYLEMLGNFSVGKCPGSYFKREAIAYTWDFLVNRLGIPADRWWAVTYTGDEEARNAWLTVGVPAERVGETGDNWWGPAGEYGPCGPNSEIHYDRGPERGCGGPNCRPETECCDRFVEVWNDVFMSFDQDRDGNKRPLDYNNVDTGMGFERLVSVVQGVPSPYETDLFEPVIRSITDLTGTPYGRDKAADLSLRIIADHARAATFIIADGVMPSSERRGYVLRRLIRRAALRGRLLGLEKPFLDRPVEAVIARMSGFHNHLEEKRDHILRVIGEEERRFSHTLARGLSILEEMAERAGQDGSITGRDAFTLYDTHGFPLELTEELAQERGLGVDRAGFEREMEDQRRRGQESAGTHSIGTIESTYVELAAQIPPTAFTGYDELRTATTVAALLAGGSPVQRIEAGIDGEIILASTPFYAEAGGQVGDQGVIRGDGSLARVLDTQRFYAPFISHLIHVEAGAIEVGDIVEAEVDAERRLHILPHHSGTHLLHKALQEVLGPQATQAGSLVAPDHLRFDFRWPSALTDDQVREVEERVNAAIWANLPVRKEIMPYDEAMKRGAMALFGEKYGELVRMVSMGDWSRELCGGTHVDQTGDIGMFLITSEGSVGSGTRRIEAVTGAAAYNYVQGLRERLEAGARALETRTDNLAGRAEQLVKQGREHERRIEELTQRLADREAESLVGQADAVDSIRIVADQIVADSTDFLEATTDAVKSRLERGIVVLASVVNRNPQFTMAVTPNLTSEGYSAKEILDGALKTHKAGGAGGRPSFARGGGRDASKVEDVLHTAVDLIRRKAEG
jgi:alanyl-tRNA synthetase